jgi:AraC family transcriptional regulator, transcriptional activator of pobA
MTSPFNDPLSQFDHGAAVANEAPSAGNSKPANPLLLKQKRSLGRYFVDPHLHRQFEQLIICERGAGTLLLDQSRQTFEAPAVLVVPSLIVHGLSFDDSSERWVVSVSKSYFQEITLRAPQIPEVFSGGGCIRFAAHDRDYLELQHVLEKLEWEQKRSASCREIVTEALLIDLLVGVLRKIQDDRARHSAENASDEEVHRGFMKMVEEHHTENWSLQRFAEALNVSVARLRTACCNTGGESPIRIINSRILLEAKRYLTHTNLSVADVARQLGFEDASYFSRFFKSRCGQTPTLYKASKRGLRRIFEQSRSTEDPAAGAPPRSKA